MMIIKKSIFLVEDGDKPRPENIIRIQTEAGIDSIDLEEDTIVHD